MGRAFVEMIGRSALLEYESPAKDGGPMNRDEVLYVMSIFYEVHRFE